MGKLSRGEIRKILGDACTDEIENALIAAHLAVVDPLKDDLQKAQADAAKLTAVQQELDGLKNGTDWKAEHDKLKKEFDDYKAEITGKETLGKVRAAYRALLDSQKISAEDAELIMAGTSFDGMKLNEDGSLNGADGLTKTIQEKYKRYIPTVDTRGKEPDNPPGGSGGTGANPRAAELARQFYERMHGKAPDNGGQNDQKN